MSITETSTNAQSIEIEKSKRPNSSLNMLVRAVLLDKKPDEVPMLVESVLSKVMEEFENRITSQVELKLAAAKDTPNGNNTLLKSISNGIKMQDKILALVERDQNLHKKLIADEEAKRRQLKLETAFDGQKKDITKLKQTLTITKVGMQFMQMKFLEEIQNLGLHIHGLASAASGYHRVLDKNRKLYNQVQDHIGNIRVYCPVRPPFEDEQISKVLWIALKKEQLPSQNGFKVPDASLVHVLSMFDVIDLMNLGHKNRVVGATALNNRSIRSHSCLTVHVQGRNLTSGAVLHGCIHLVDLAGSERVDKSEVAGERLKEAQHINRSLSALGDVISSLSQKNSHVPYRNNNLTQLLQDSLGGQGKTLMFVHISPKLNVVGETLSTLKFAERVATVELGAPQVHKHTPDVKELD
ncbi:hypothetical protein LXL04_028443 [Taraxacum kok-saghyz]